MKRLAGLDLDGTLIDSAPDLSDALGEALSSLGLPRPTEAETRGWIGDGIELLIKRGITAARRHAPHPGDMATALAAFDAYYVDNSYRRSQVYPEVSETLVALREAGWMLACITNKRAAFALPMLEKSGLRPYFDTVYGGDSLPRKKPAPDQLIAAAAECGCPAETAVMIGDSPNDMDAAAAAGWGFIHADYGYTAGMEARQPKPAQRVRRFAGIAGYLLNAGNG